MLKRTILTLALISAGLPAFASGADDLKGAWQLTRHECQDNPQIWENATVPTQLVFGAGKTSIRTKRGALWTTQDRMVPVHDNRLNFSASAPGTLFRVFTNSFGIRTLVLTSNSSAACNGGPRNAIFENVDSSI